MVAGAMPINRGTRHRAHFPPVRQIVLDCGTKGAIVAEKIKNHLDDPNFGFNATTERCEDRVKPDQTEPAKVTRTALRDAASIASLILTLVKKLESGWRWGARNGSLPRPWRQHAIASSLCP